MYLATSFKIGIIIESSKMQVVRAKPINFRLLHNYRTEVLADIATIRIVSYIQARCLYNSRESIMQGTVTLSGFVVTAEAVYMHRSSRV